MDRRSFSRGILFGAVAAIVPAGALLPEKENAVFKASFKISPELLRDCGAGEIEEIVRYEFGKALAEEEARQWEKDMDLMINGDPNSPTPKGLLRDGP